MLRRLMMAGAGAGAGNPDLPWTAIQLHFESNSGTILVDSSPSPKSVSMHGDAVLTTTSPKFGSKCLRADPVGGTAGVYIQPGPGGSFAPGTGDFNFDWWFNVDSVGYEQNMFDMRATTNGANGFQIDFHPSYGLLFYSPLGGGIKSAGITPSAGAWHHFEVSRTGTTARMFLDGTQITSWTDTNNYSNSQAYLGGVTYTPLGVVPMKAYFDEFRGLIGKGGHTANFTPPTAPYGDT